MSDIEYSVITSDVIKSFDCTMNPDQTAAPLILYSLLAQQEF